MRRILLIAWLAFAPGACGGSDPKVVSAVAGLPEYAPEEAALFGDDFSATVFGRPKEIEPAQDQKLAERTQRADAIVPVRVATVSAESLAGVRGYTIAVVTDGPPVSGSPPADALEIRVRPGNPSLTQVQLMDTGLVGKRFLLFMRRYSDGGEAVLHFHSEGDGPDVRKAIDSAKALDSLKDRPHTAN